MAEIILEPTVQSKVIPLSLRLNDTDTSLVSQLVTNRQFNTADTDAWFSFTLEGLAATTGTFDLTLINLHDKSVFNHTDKVFNTNPFYYRLDSGTDELTNEIRHAGKWVGQLVVTLVNGDLATRKFIFGIEGHILDGTVVQTILLEDYNALINSIESAKEELTAYNIDYSTLISTVESQEASRVQAELTREQTFNALVDSEIIAQNVATELQNVEATYAPRLLSTEQQLADTLNKSAITLTHMFADSTARDAYFVAHPTELVELQFIKVGTAYQQYIEGSWTDSVPIVSEQLSATNQPIVDTGEYFVAETTNEALQELGAHKASATNPHGVTKVQVGLGNVDNTSDVNKPVSTTMQTALNAKANKVQEAWITPTLVNAWVAGSFAPAYMKDEMGFVHLKGQVKSGTTYAFVLPVNYRPVKTTRIPIYANGLFGFVNIQSGGEVYITGNNTDVYLDGVTFRTD